MLCIYMAYTCICKRRFAYTCIYHACISMPLGMSICYVYRCICYVYRCISMFLVRWSGFQMLSGACPACRARAAGATSIWNPHTWKFRGIYLVYPRVMTIYVVRQGYTRYIPVIWQPFSYPRYIPGIYLFHAFSSFRNMTGIYQGYLFRVCNF